MCTFGAYFPSHIGSLLLQKVFVFCCFLFLMTGKLEEHDVNHFI